MRFKTYGILFSRPHRPDLQAIIRAIAYCGGPFMMEPALRVYDEQYHPSRIAGKPDPYPSLTRTLSEDIDFTAWKEDPKNLHQFFRLAVPIRRAQLSSIKGAAEALFSADDVESSLRASTRVSPWLRRTGQTVAAQDQSSPSEGRPDDAGRARYEDRPVLPVFL